MKHIVGEDLGYGYDKAVTEGRTVTLESILGPAVTIKYHNDLIANGHGLEVELRGKGWFVGELARLQSPFTVSPRARERDPEIVQILSLAALYALGITDGEVYLGTGLPVAWYQDREQLTRALVGHHTPVINGQRCDLEIVDALVIPQPFGSFFRLLLNPAGVLVDQDSLARERVAVLDIGTHTTDYALADGLRHYLVL